jgi:tRNA threonylcarbamoyladenosine modification (KEOPS) complex Cgi121 subunit
MSKTLCAEVRVKDPESADEELAALRKSNPGLVIQLVGLASRPNTRAIEMIAAQTLRAKETGALIATKPEVDLLLRIAGTAQISVAFEKVGYKTRDRRFLVAAGPDAVVKRLERSLKAKARTDRYDVLSGDSLDANGIAMVERAALLGTRR